MTSRPPLACLRLAAAAALLLCGVAAAGEELRVAATTSLLGCAASRVGGERVRVTVMVPPGACPGHFDMKPSEARSIEECDLLLRHGFESFLPRALPRRVRDLAVRPAENDMIPPGQAEAARLVAEAFAEMRPEWGAFFRERLGAYLEELGAAGREITGAAETLGVREVPVAVSVRLEPFFRWMGFRRILAYGIPEEMTPRKMAGHIERAKRMEVALVADNAQSGSDTGLPIARETGAGHVVLRFFPERDGYVETLRRNAELVIEGVKAWEARRSPTSGE
ncbi:MAG: metal ABC transporter substrate-binding protein [bacterium]|nr:metal ABC transporter substrate-binding protein [bacterium]